MHPLCENEHCIRMEKSVIVKGRTNQESDGKGAVTVKITKVSFYTDIDATADEMTVMLRNLIHEEKDKVYQLHVENSREISEEEAAFLDDENCDMGKLAALFESGLGDMSACADYPWIRELRKNAEFRHFKTGKIVEVVGLAANTEHPDELDVVYIEKNHNTMWHRPAQMFCSRVDREKYPNAQQEWRFEPVNWSKPQE